MGGRSLVVGEQGVDQVVEPLGALDRPFRFHRSVEKAIPLLYGDRTRLLRSLIERYPALNIVGKRKIRYKGY